MMLTDEELIRVMKIDPLGVIEDATGIHHSHPTLGDAATSASLPIFHSKSVIIEREMRARGDTHPQMSLEEFDAALKAEGFEHVMEEPVKVASYASPSWLLVYAHRDGMLVEVRTYGEDRRVGGMNPNLLLNLSGDGYWNLPFYGSGGMGKDGIAAISLNIDTGFRLKMKTIRENGALVSPWAHPPFIWLLSYQEGCDLGGHDQCEAREKLTSERIAMLPDWVRAFMGRP